MRNLIFTSLFVFSVIVLTSCYPTKQSIHRTVPRKVGIDLQHLLSVDPIIHAAIDNGEIPGAVLAVVRRGSLVYLKAYGNKSIYPTIEPMSENTVFDLASVSKPVGTAISIMQLVENGKLLLTDPVSKYIPGFLPWTDPQTNQRVEIRIINLLTHTSGLPSYITASLLTEKYGSPNPKALIDSIATCKRQFRPATGVLYSCLNYITLQNVLQNITGQPLCDYAKEHIFDVLGMKHTMYNPTGVTLALTAPTEKLADGSVLLGKVHDPLARLLNDGNSGNAGVFSNAEDLALLSAALMNGGAYKGKRILSPLTVQTMMRVPEGLESFERNLGWGIHTGSLFDPDRSYSHSGYTGTSIFIDPVSQTAVILLTHRVHPEDKGNISRLRALVLNVVASAIVKK